MTHTIELPIYRPFLTANDQRRAHWTVVRKAKADTEMLVLLAARRAKMPKIDHCHITITWHAPDAKIRDTDSLGPCLKACLDGLVKAGFLVSDDHRHVLSTTQRIEVDRARPRITITIEEAENAD